MTRRIARLALLFPVVAVLAACTHQFNLTAHASPPLSLARSGDKRVAVVFLPGNVQANYTSSTDGHTFVFNDVPMFYRSAFASALRGSVADVQFFLSVPTVPFDAYIYPESRIETSGMLKHSCTVRFALTLLDDAGRVLAREQGESVGVFVPIAAAGEACSAAMRQSFDEVSAKGVRPLDGV